MTHKTTMPEPVAWRTRYPAEPGMVGQYPWHYTDYEPKRLAFAPEKESLITTTQAEAYKDDCVREALEEAAKIADSNNDFATYDAILALQSGNSPNL